MLVIHENPRFSCLCFYIFCVHLPIHFAVSEIELMKVRRESALDSFNVPLLSEQKKNGIKRHEYLKQSDYKHSWGTTTYEPMNQKLI